MSTATSGPGTLIDHPTVREIRRRWKPTKERLRHDEAHQPLLIRVHRCCSWLQRVEQIEAAEATDAIDAVLIFRWIALNSLYGKWNEQRREPVPDAECLPRFLDRVLELDEDGLLAAVLEEHKRLAMSIFDDEYLSKLFWENPTDAGAKRSKRVKFDARTWYREHRYKLILDQLMRRIYLLRCQLVHGAATFGGQLNRKPLKRCTTMLAHLQPPILYVIMDHGVDEDWGALCYPPQ